MSGRDRDENSPAQGRRTRCESPDLSTIYLELCVARCSRCDLAKMQVIGAWCRHEGKPGYLGEREPFDNLAPTHGVCLRHREQFLESLLSTSFPDAELLIVVRPTTRLSTRTSSGVSAGCRA